METIRIIIADDHAMAREGLRDWIEQEDDLLLIGEAETSYETVLLCQREKPDILLQDIQMANSQGIEVIRQIKSLQRALPILALSGLGKHYARVALEAGADGFLCKEERRPVVMEAIRWVARKMTSTWVSPLAANALLSSQEQVKKHHLTFTEQEIVKHLRCSNKEIASRLYISEGTVKNHVSAIYSKLGLRTRQQAIQWAEQHGFLISSTLPA